MESRHAITLALLLGAFALVFALTGLFVLQYASLTTGGRIFSFSGEARDESIKPPRFLSKIEGSQAVIAEIDAEGNTLHAIYTSSLLDNNVDFSLFAVPQEHYKNIIYVQAVTDAELAILKIYPLNIETGKLGVSILNVNSEAAKLSTNQEHVAIVAKKNLSIYDLQTGRRIGSWELPPGEDWGGENKVINGAWRDTSCFELAVWYGEQNELRAFCTP